jgi:hypothetical protein
VPRQFIDSSVGAASIPQTLRRPLYRSFELALLGHSGADARFRELVGAAIRELQTQGADGVTSVRAIESLLMQHPRVHALDRISVLDGSHTTDRVLSRVRGWAARELMKSVAAAGVPDPR